jgi:translocation and assembly module TamB
VLGLVVLGILLTVGVALLLHSDRFHTYLLRTAQQKASEAIGSGVHFRDFAFSWHGIGPSVELYGIVVRGAPPYIDPPLLEANSLRVQVTIGSFLHRSWYVNEFRVERPVVRVLADQQGRTNLPHATSSNNSQSNTSVFDLGIRHLLIEKGEIYYNDRKSDLNADVHELSLQSAFEVTRKRYSGTLSYRNGHVQWQGANPVVHNLDARFSATREEFTLESAQLRTQSSSLSITAIARDYAQPNVQATYEAALDGAEFRRVLKNASIPVGVIQSSGILDYKSDPARPFLAVATIKGEIHSSRLAVPYKQTSATISNLGARYVLANGNANVTGIRADLLGGKVSGTFAARNLTGETRSNLAVQVNGASIDQIQKLLVPASTSQASLHGSVSTNADAKWGKTMADLLAHADLTLRAGLQPAHGGPETPVTGTIHTAYAASNETLSFAQSSLRTPQTSLSVDGTVSKRSTLNVRLESRELNELESLAAAFQSPSPKPMNLHGQATLTATVSGSTSNPQIQGQLTASNIAVRGTSWKLLRTRISASPSAVRLDNGELTPTSKGRITFQLGSDLQQWAFTPSSSFQVRLNASGLNATELGRAAGITTPLSGTLSADVRASGTQLSPTGHGTIELSGARIGDEPIRSVNLTFDGNGSSVNAKLRGDLPAGSLRADVQYEPRQQAYEASLQAVGIKLEQLETVKAKNLALTGELNVTASGRGTVQDPALKASVEIPRLQVRDQVINGLRLDTEVANHVAKLNLASQILGTRADGHGTIQLTGDYPADLTFDTGTIPFQPLMAMYAPSQAASLSGQTELHATLRGPLKNRTALEAHAVIPNLNLNYKNAVQLAAAGPIRADYVNGVLDVKRSTIRGTGTELTFQANVPAAKDARISLLLQGTVDLRLAQMMDPDMTSSGQIRFDIDSFGARSNLDVQGQIRIVNASFTQAGVPLGLRDGNGVLALTRNRLDVTQFQGTVGGGVVTARGGIVYRPNLYFDLAMQANDVRVLYQQSLRTTIGSRLALTGQYDHALLQGQVNVEQLSFTSNFDLMDMAAQFGGGAATPPPTGGFAEKLNLQVSIQTPSGLSSSTRNLSVSGSANLHVRGTAAQPVILGRINLSDSELIFSGNRYQVQSGTIDFRNPSRTEPVVDISANTTIQQYEIQMHFWGPADHLHTNYSSDPSLPPADVINLIAFGKTSEAAAANPTPPGTLGAQSLLASQVSSQVTSRVEKLAGISQLSIDPVLGSSQQSPGAHVTVQQRVTGKIFVTFSTDLTSTTQQEIKLEYQLNRRASLTVVRNQNGGVSFETTFRKGW